MRKSNPQGYANLLNRVMESSEEMGEQVDPHFQNLKKTVTLKGIESLGDRELHEIVAMFQKAVDLYQQNATLLKKAQPPVQVLGRHKQLVSSYQTYAQDCELMLKSIDEKNIPSMPISLVRPNRLKIRTWTQFPKRLIGLWHSSCAKWG
ncbi:hypothetical protein ACLJJ6_07775 [Pediococcus siamensis]|uniref:hypothetical protein n=1 Tax=Pediococcus siamensis TaxID=381829 RepID=UPI0039A3787A